MGLFNKIKGILFEEVEEDEVENISKKEASYSEKKPIAERIEPQKKEPVVTDVPKVSVQMPKKEEKKEPLSDRDLFKNDKSFSFPDFDEEEFSNMSRVQKPKPTTNVLEYEKKRKVEKKYDLGRYERIERTEVVEKKKFRPSPIISPVYGILNEDYKPEDIKSKETVPESSNLDFNSVRKKAFGEIKKEEPTSSYYEETVTVKLKENDEEKKQKVKTIDELLEDTSDMIIDVKDDVKNKLETLDEPVIEPEIMDNSSVYEKVDDDLEELTQKEEPIKTHKEKVEDDDTLENDLFDLIDSMYDNREDGDI